MRKKSDYLFVLSLSSLLAMFLGAMLLFAGTSFNYLAVTENGCRMPVLEKFSKARDTETHFGYYNLSEVNYSRLTDTFYVGDYIYSMGDGLLYTGTGIIVLGVFMQVFIILKIIWKKNVQPCPKKRIL